MNLKDALEQLKKDKKITEADLQVVGVTYCNQEFSIIHLAYDREDEWFSVSVYGGQVLSDIGIEDVYADCYVDDLLFEIPAEFHDLNYRSYSLDEDVISKAPEYPLMDLFPELRGLDEGIYPTKEEIENFIMAAQKLIDNLNSKEALPLIS